MGNSYDLHWKSIPMGAIQSYADWYVPYIGTGVYIFVLSTTGGGYVGYYVGKSDDIGRRWYEHLHGDGKRDAKGQRISWFGNPVGISIPKNVDDFLADPVAVLNARALVSGQADSRSRDTVKKMLGRSWFCWAEVNCHPGDRIEDVEYAIQEGLKKHVGITVHGEIGESPFYKPPICVSKVCNHFGKGNEFLVPVLPKCILEGHQTR